MIRYARPAALALAAGLLAACGHAVSPASTAAHQPGSRPLSCRQQYQDWKHGPARAAVLKVKAAAARLSTAGNSDDITSTTSALRQLGRAAGGALAYPVPRCADPSGYYTRWLALMKAAGDNARLGSGLGSLLMAEAPLKRVPHVQSRLTAELHRTVGTGHI